MKYLLLLLLALKGFSQPKDEIKLPKGGKKIEIKSLTNLYSLYITKNQEVYNDDKKLEYFQDINYTLLDQKNKIPEPWIAQKVLLYADAHTKYKFIDKIKSHITSTFSLFYMTDNIYDLIATSFRFNNFSKKSFLLEEINSLQEEELIESSSITMDISDFANPWWVELERDLYSDNKEVIQGAINQHNHTLITVSPNKALKHKDLLLNDNNLKALIKSNKVLYLDFDDNTYYEDYLDAIQKIKKHQIALEKKQEEKAYVIEVSINLKKHLNQMGVELN
ncbi:hypothetical protein PW52_16725 [Tamlana sedimentorum]|uniref:Uncharacterized protein n=1 Tax=Neotamlana sedimentorum TaxID=1435349 RepID=A0A0D7VWW5_9FLAO|nr:hypothetical protein [Tamlana sedimentorum]KJD31326.1 hypothetical protein PW52_16725 [Tamlana sedimentorum]